jgi:hypothetical protein
MKLSQIQPSKLYINSERLSEVMTALARLKPDLIRPIPVKKLGDKIIFTDGHTLALAAFLHGASEVRVYWEKDELDWDAYEICADWCRKEGVHTIADLKNRVVPPQQYESLWINRCQKIEEQLETRRKQESLTSTKIST